ncbi:MAG: hypothetical protein JNL09_01790 [Anaerolineales bacterium]|nr:hypothetical protein [Anaerolineales bacterium]
MLNGHAALTERSATELAARNQRGEVSATEVVAARPWREHVALAAMAAIERAIKLT